MGGRNSRPVWRPWRPPPPPPPPPQPPWEQINRLKGQIDQVSRENNNRQTNIFNTQRNLTNQSRYYDGRLYSLGQENDYYVGQNAVLLTQYTDLSNNIDKLGDYTKLASKKIRSNWEDKKLAIIDLNLNKANVYQSIKNENDLIMETIPNMEIAYSSDTQKIEYEKKNISDLDTANTVLFYIYYALFVFFAILIINKNISKYSKFAIVVILLLYPLLIYKIQKAIYLGLINMYVLLVNNVYLTS